MNFCIFIFPSNVFNQKRAKLCTENVNTSFFSSFRVASKSQAKDWMTLSFKARDLSILEALAQLPFEEILRLLPWRDLARMQTCSWTLFNRLMFDKAWQGICL